MNLDDMLDKNESADKWPTSPDQFEPPKLKNPNKEPKVRTSDKPTKAELELWDPREMPMKFDWIPQTREKKARARVAAGSVSVVVPGKSWECSQMEEFGDRYDVYRIRLEDGRFKCTCQGHAYGDTRMLCTHAIAAILVEYKADPVVVSEVGSVRSASVDDLFNFGYVVNELVAKEVEQAKQLPMQITEELVSMVEQANISGNTLVLDPWEVCYPAEYLIDWYPAKYSPEDIDMIELSPEDQKQLVDEWVHKKNAADRMLAIEEMPDPSRWDLPAHFSSLRPHQWDALRQIIMAWASGKKYVFLDAPTGAGKSILGCISFLEWAGIGVGKEEAKGMIAVTSKDLQDQMDKDFNSSWWFAMIKGRMNYPTANFEDRFLAGKEWSPGVNWDSHLDCSDCEFSTKKHCRYCDPPGVTGPVESGASPCLGRCPYQVQLRKLLKRPLGMTNMAYLLRVANSMAWGQFEDRTVLIVDESDTLESVLMGYVTVEVSEKKLAVLGQAVGRPTLKTMGENGREDWFAWAGRAKARVSEILSRRALQLKGEIPIGDAVGEDKIKVTSDQRDLRRDIKQWETLSENLTVLIDSLTKGDPWIYDGYQVDRDTKAETGPVVFKPVRVNMFGPAKLFDKFKTTLMMSATLISSDQIARDLGIPEGDYATVSVPRTFDPARCPVNVMAVADNSFKEQENSWPVLSAAISKIVFDNPDHRIMIHAVSYVQAEKVFRYLKAGFPTRSILTHQKDSGSKKKTLEVYEKTPGAVLISPSMARGADFKGDLCRVQILIKVPFPNLGDKQISARLHSTYDGQTWYSVQTIRELVQMTGRGMRSESDWCVSWILDKQFLNIWGKNQDLFPEWWRRSVHFIRGF